MFDTCEAAAEDNLPPGIQLVRAGAAISEDHVLMVAQLDGPPVDIRDAQSGDWQLAVRLQLWEPVGDHNEALYEFNHGSLNFAGLVPRDGRGGGLVDPAKVDYFVDGTYVGVLVELSALSAISDASTLSFVAQGMPQVFIEGGQPPSRTGVVVGWEERGSQWCPNPRETSPIGAASGRGPGAAESSTSTAAPSTSTSAVTPPTSSPDVESQCEGVSSCGFKNGIDFSRLREELATALSADGFPTQPDDVDCETNSPGPPNRVPVGSSLGCVVTPDVNGSLTYFDVTVTGVGTYSWDYADV